MSGHAGDPARLFPHARTLPTRDGTSLPTEVLDAAYALWSTATGSRGALLIHCFAGVSRSASVAYGVLRRAGVPRADALERVWVAPGPHKELLASADAWTATQVPAGRAPRARR